jgi:hypothetical protein
VRLHVLIAAIVDIIIVWNVTPSTRHILQACSRELQSLYREDVGSRFLRNGFFLCYFRTLSILDLVVSITVYANHHTVACTAVAMQRPRDKANIQLPFLDDGSVNTYPRQRIRMQQ